ncbi:hypothetical protein SBOR_0552 [Sclerotinia borealis F-4128]|uniref:Bromo domain-containing protein n=1 Tax=Sclerotinia borealis (strain F-4128) TaxID=1432307 RepID=W9CSC5_SCLBF|nr:hypothetical protein SBOR_0552 [Sclerotinia borealis F-4128]
MDSKRKVNGGGNSSDQDDADRAAKRRKLPVNGDMSKGQTPETTTYYGLILLNQLRTGLDKQGRPFATNFLTLPDRKEFAAYYAVTKMPVAFDTVQEKLDNRDFATLSELESFFKRLVKNAKDYNERESIIHRDAERIRKAVVKFMTDNNPEYKTNPGLKLEPTPIGPIGLVESRPVVPRPAEPAPVATEQDDSDADAEGEPEDLEEQQQIKIEPQPIVKRRGRPPKNPGAPRKSTTPAVSDSHYAGVSFSGLTFQQAQEKILADVLSHKEDPADEFFEFEPFVTLPPRSLKDYYQVIPNPHCLKDLQKRVKGTHGKSSTGVSDFKSWAALEEDASLIWKNAYHYNEDGSEIFVLAKDLETFFKKTLEEAKKFVPEPVTPKIKINVKVPEPTPKITLRVGVATGGRATDSPAPLTSGSNGTATSGTSSNSEARRNPFVSSHSAAASAPNFGQLERARSMSNSAASPTLSNAVPVKSEDTIRKSPAAPIEPTPRPISQTVSTPKPAPSNMLPPHTPSASNHNTYNQGGYAQSFNHQPSQSAANLGLESKWRAPGTTAAHAMITNLSIATHPRLNVSRHFHMDLPPSATLAQQSITINLPATHYYLQIKPTIAQALLERQYKIFVTSGVTRLHAIPLIPNHGVDPRQPLFEARLLPGVNKIEVELIAALPKGAAKPAGGPDVEIEKVTVFANLMRN